MYAKELSENLSQELEVMCHIMLNAKASFDVVLYFNHEDHNQFKSVNRERMSSDFFRFVEVNFFRTTIIELFKLYSPNTQDYYSIYSLKKRFNPGKVYEAFEVSQNLINHINAKLKQSKLEIEKLRDLRNKVYAHNDQEYKKYLGYLNIAEISTLINIAKDILGGIYSETLNESYFFDSPAATPVHSLKHLFEKIEFYNDNYEQIVWRSLGSGQNDKP